MKDILDNDIHIGDKVVFLPSIGWTPSKLQYGIVKKMTQNNHGAYCESLNDNYNRTILRYSHQILKLQ